MVFTGVWLLTGGTPSPSHNTSTSIGPMFFPGGAPSPFYNSSTGPRSLPRGYPQSLGPGPFLARDTRWGTPNQDRMGYPQPGLDGVLHQPGLDGVTPSRTGWHLNRLCRGWYVSCSSLTGGLSCWLCYSSRNSNLWIKSQNHPTLQRALLGVGEDS